MKRLIELALYQETRRRKLKMREIRNLLSISMSKVGLLSKHLKEHYAHPEVEHGVARKILTLLWAGPLSEQKIAQSLANVRKADVKAALRALVADKRVVIEEGRTVSRYKLGVVCTEHPLLRDLAVEVRVEGAILAIQEGSANRFGKQHGASRCLDLRKITRQLCVDVDHLH